MLKKFNDSNFIVILINSKSKLSKKKKKKKKKKLKNLKKFGVLTKDLIYKFPRKKI
jgi:hypothetical protein